MTFRLRLRVVLLGAFALAAAAAALPVAAEPEGERSVRVRVSDVNLNSPEGAKIVRARIERAAEAVCGGRPDIRDLVGARSYRACHASAVKEARADFRQTAARAGPSGAGARGPAAR